MSNVSQYSTSASGNDAAPPNGFPENQRPSTLNDGARELMAALARWYGDTQGSLVSSGSSNAYTLTTNSNHAALADQSMLAFRADRANTGAVTLAVDGLAAKDLVRADGEALKSGDIQANHMVVVAYNSTVDKYLLVSSTSPRDASETLKGIAELATQSETDAGTDDARIVTPKKLKTWADSWDGASMKLLQTEEISSQSTVALGSGGEIDSTYDDYVVVFSGLVPSDDNVRLQIRTAPTSGGSVDSGSSDYQYGTFFYTSNESASGSGVSNSSAIRATGDTIGNSAGQHVNGSFHLYAPADASLITTLVGQISYIRPNGSLLGESISGSRNTAAAVGRVELSFDSGTIASGKAKLYGVRDS